jgi:hypothetical protein
LHVLSASPGCGLEVGQLGQQTQDKRQCIRQLEELSELVDEAQSKPKGMSNYLLDLAGNKLYTRNKTDIPQREEDLWILFRGMDRIRMEFGVSTDLVLQVEIYRAMLCEQGDTRAEDRHSAFISCGLISRIHRLQFFTKTLHGRIRAKIGHQRHFITRGFYHDGADHF